MAIRSAPPPSAGLVYTILTTLGVLAALAGAALMAYIVYEYVWDDQALMRRNPPPVEEGAQAPLPSFVELA